MTNKKLLYASLVVLLSDWSIASISNTLNLGWDVWHLHLLLTKEIRWYFVLFTFLLACQIFATMQLHLGKTSWKQDNFIERQIGRTRPLSNFYLSHTPPDVVIRNLLRKNILCFSKKKRLYFQEYIRYSHIYKRAATKIKGTATEYCPSQDNISAGHSKSDLHCKASGTRKSLDDKVVNTVRQSNIFNSTIFSLWHYRFDLCQTIQITKCIPPIALAEGRVAETSLGKILALPRRGGSESELLSLTLPRFCCGIDNRQVFTLRSKVTIAPLRWWIPPQKKNIITFPKR